jgi:general secretion pathway protein K
VPLAEARLSTFLAADRNVTQIDDAGREGLPLRPDQRPAGAPERDEPGGGDGVSEAALARSAPVRAAGPATGRAHGPGAGPAPARHRATSGDAPLLPAAPSQLAWLGLAPRTLALLAPHITLLPERKPVNLNTAGAEVLMATLRPGRAGADRIMAVRQMQPFRSVDDVKAAGRADRGQRQRAWRGVQLF